MNKTICLLILFAISAAVAAEPMSDVDWQQLSQEAASLVGDRAAAVAAGTAQPVKCAAPLFISMALGQPKGDLPKALDYERQDTLSFSYSTAHFKLHYTSTGANAVYQFSTQDSIPGTPDFVFEAGKALEYVYRHYVNDLAFKVPLSDAYYSGGGDGLLDIYFINFGAYGATVPESLKISATGCTIATSYMFLENDYQGFGYDDRLDPLRVTCAHELFHMFQFAQDVGEIEGSGADQNPAWIEMSAVFMEEENYSAVNDYYNYLPYFYAFPQWSIRTGTTRTSPQINVYKNLHMYGAGVWPIFLARQFGSSIIKNIWDSCGAVPGPNWWTATNGCIKARSGDTADIRSMFRKFAVWNLFTGTWARGSNYFPEAGHYPRTRFFDTTNTYASVVSLVDSLHPDNLGANYIMLTNLQTVPTGVAVSFNPDRTQPWGLMVVGVPLTVSDTTQAIFIDSTIYDSSTRVIQIPNVAGYARIMLIPMVLGGNGVEASYTLSITPLREGVALPNGGEQLYSGTRYNIAWYFPPDSVQIVRIDLSTDNGVTWPDTIAYVQNSASVYTWTVPDISSDSCLIRISDTASSGINDVSDAVFTIISHGTTIVYEPYPDPAWIEHFETNGDTYLVHFKAELATSLTNGSQMDVTILTLAGEKVRELTSDKSQGEIVLTWDFRNKNGTLVAAGPYLAVIKLAGDSKTYIKKFMVMR